MSLIDNRIEIRGTNFNVKRNKTKYAAGIAVVILLGLVSRLQTSFVPATVKEYGGDVLWALVVYLTVGFLFPRLPIGKAALAAGLVSLTVEVSQLYHADWLDALRRTRLGGLLLGHGFLWSDLLCYCVGIVIGTVFERLAARRSFFKR